MVNPAEREPGSLLTDSADVSSRIISEFSQAPAGVLAEACGLMLSRSYGNLPAQRGSAK
jgi:hypothetical protein